MSRTLARPAPNRNRPPPPAVFACSWINGDPDATCIHVTGELDIATTPQLELTLREAQAQARLVVLDLRELAFIDSTGIHTIVDASIRARQDQRRLVVLRGPPHVDRLFTLTASGRQLEFGDAYPVKPERAPARRRTQPGVAGGYPDFRGAGATIGPQNVTRTLVTRAAAALLWLRSAPPSKLPGGTSTDVGVTPHP